MLRNGFPRVLTTTLATALTMVVSLALPGPVAHASSPDLTPIEQLGKRLFFDTNLSYPAGMACATCHSPATGFTGPDSDINAAGGVHPGAVAGRFGNRMPPTVAYAGLSPVLASGERGWVGGLFWDGSATGWTLGDPLVEQAKGPFMNPLEQNNPSVAALVRTVSRSDYTALFRQVWGPRSLEPFLDPNGTFERIARSIAAYERSHEVNAFTSKYDYYLRGQAKLTAEEQWGLQLYQTKGQCDACHPSGMGENGESPLFTNFGYANIGMPRNPLNPFYHAPIKVNPLGEAWIDPGLGGMLAAHRIPQAQASLGKHKIPTLRNVDLRPAATFVKAYGHNAYFKSLNEIVHFFNSRDVVPWPAPEVAATVDRSVVGNLSMTPLEESAIVAFLGTLSDGYVPPSTPRKPRDPGETGATEPPVAVEWIGARPNPATQQMTISFALPVPAAVELVVYDVRGRAIRTLATGEYPAGVHAVSWDGRDGRGSSVANGAYFCRLQAGSVTRVRTLVWMR